MQEEVIEATIIEKIGEVPITIGLFNIGLATVDEDRSVVLKFTDTDVADEFVERVINGFPTGVSIMT